MFDNIIFIWYTLIPVIGNYHYQSLEESTRPIDNQDLFEIILNNYSHLATIGVDPFINTSILVLKIGTTAARLAGTSVDP